MSRSSDVDMVEIARRVLLENGFAPDPPKERANDTAATDDDTVDLRDRPWSSIDNEDSRDLDQIELAEPLADGAVRLWIGIADVDALVPRGSPIDEYAYVNTTSLYTGVHVFPMLPVALSNDRTSLLADQDRAAVVTEIVVHADGSIDDAATKVYPARVRNHAKLVYEWVGAWLEDGPGGARPDDPVVADQVELHDAAAQRLRARRKELGALEL